MEEMGRTLALDVGDVRIGVAVSDPLGITAQPLEVIRRSTLEADVAAVVRIATDKEAVRIVVGMPLNEKGEQGPQAIKVQAFADVLRDAAVLEIVTQDERFSTAESERMLIGADMSRKRRKEVIDKVAAQRILQTYMDRRRRLEQEKR